MEKIVVTDSTNLVLVQVHFLDELATVALQLDMELFHVLIS